MVTVANGWKPGAISKCLLRKLNEAKLRTSIVEQSKNRLKKTKKRMENKPTLIVCKVNGEYRVEMQVTGENGEGNVEQYKPLVYKIASANNKEKICKLERKKRRLIRDAVKEVWRHPDKAKICENTCLKAYKQAVGLLPFDPSNPDYICSEDATEEVDTSPSCSCDDEDVSSNCSSLDIDWEIHFTPPSAYCS